MPDTNDKPEKKQPSFDPHKLLDQLKGFVNDRKKPAASAAGGGKFWVGTLVVVAVVLVGIAVWAWISWRRGRELAKLRHESNKRKILLAHEVVAKKVAKNDAAIAEAAKRVEASKVKLRMILADIKAEEKRYEADLRAIDDIRSWRDAGVR